MIKKVAKFAMILLLMFGTFTYASVEVSAEFDDTPDEDVQVG